MYGYASGSAVASTLTPFSPPPQTTNPAGAAVQAAAVGQAAGVSAAAPSASALSRLVSTVPTLLQNLASGTLSLPSATDLLNFSSGATFVASGVLFILGPALTGPVKAALPAAAAIGPGLGPASGADERWGAGPGRHRGVGRRRPGGVDRRDVGATGVGNGGARNRPGSDGDAATRPGRFDGVPGGRPATRVRRDAAGRSHGGGGGGRRRRGGRWLGGHPRRRGRTISAPGPRNPAMRRASATSPRPLCCRRVLARRT